MCVGIWKQLFRSQVTLCDFVRHGIPWSADLFLIFWPRVFKILIKDAHQFSLSSFQNGPMFLVRMSFWVSMLEPLSSLAHLKSVGCSFCISAASDFLWEGWLVHINYDQYQVWLMLVDKHHACTRSSLIHFACIWVAPPRPSTPQA